MTLSITITKPFSYDEDDMRSEPRPEDVQQRSILLNDENVGMMATDPYDGFKGLRFALNSTLNHDQRDAILHVALKIITQESGEIRLWNSDLFNDHRALFEKHGFKEQFSELPDGRPGTCYVRAAIAPQQINVDTITITKSIKQDQNQRHILLNGNPVAAMFIVPCGDFTRLAFIFPKMDDSQITPLLDAALKEVTQESGEIRLLNRENIFEKHRAIFGKYGFCEIEKFYDDRRPSGDVFVSRPAKAQTQEPTTNPPLSAREAFYYGLPTTPTSLGAGAKPARHNKQFG